MEVAGSTCVQWADLVVKSGYKVAVPRCIMGDYGSFKVPPPDSWTTRSHDKGGKFIHT